MFSLLKKEKFKVVAPCEGVCIPITEVSDKIFSSKMMGDGFAIIPQGDVVLSPIQGEVVMIAPTKHAFGVRSKDGVEVLVHIGIDSVTLNGEGFEVLVQEGDKVKVGTCIVRCNFALLKNKNIETTTIVVMTMGYSEKISLTCEHCIVRAGQILIA